MKNLNVWEINALIDEMSIAEKLILNWIRELQNKYGKEDLFIPFLLLFQWVERFLKISLFIADWSIDQTHKIKDLNCRFIDLVKNKDRRKLIQKSIEFLKNDYLLISIIDILDHFADAKQWWRYNNLNILLGKADNNTEIKLSDTIYKIIKENPILNKKLTDPKEFDFWYIDEYISEMLISTIEKYICAVNFQFTMCEMWMRQTECYSYIFINKLFWIDKNRGKISYEEKYFSKKVFESKKMKVESNYKRIKVLKLEYEKSRPIKDFDEVEIEVRDHYPILLVWWYEYALTWGSSFKFNLPLPHEAKIAYIWRDASFRNYWKI